jgi:hypothetical protein
MCCAGGWQTNLLVLRALAWVLALVLVLVPVLVPPLAVAEEWEQGLVVGWEGVWEGLPLVLVLAQVSELVLALVWEQARVRVWGRGVVLPWGQGAVLLEVGALQVPSTSRATAQQTNKHTRKHTHMGQQHISSQPPLRLLGIALR